MSLTVLEQGCNNHYILARLHQVTVKALEMLFPINTSLCRLCKQSQIKLCLTVFVDFPQQAESEVFIQPVLFIDPLV